MSVRKTEPHLRYCARCRRLFQRLRGDVCDGCLAVERADRARIREELSQAPELTVDELAERANVTAMCVLRMLDEGLITSAHNDGHFCKRCGARALDSKRRLCMACLLERDHELNQELQETQIRKRARAVKDGAQGVFSMLHLKRRYNH